MANLQSLRVRISSVKSTRKITSAMKMVAASRLRRAHDATIKAEPYAYAIRRSLSGLIQSLVERQENFFVRGLGVIRPPRLLIGHQQNKTHLIIALTSDKGLCGAFNMNVCKRVAAMVIDTEKEGKRAKILCVGKKGYELLKRDFGDLLIGKIEGVGRKAIAYKEAEDVAFRAISLFELGEVDSCSMVYNHFKTAISQEVKVEKLFPLDDYLPSNPWKGLTEMDFLMAPPPPEVSGDDWDLGVSAEGENLPSQTLERSASRYALKAEDSYAGRGAGSWTPGGGHKKSDSRKMSIPAGMAGMKATAIDLDALKPKYAPFLYDFDPSDAVILEHLIPRFIVSSLFKALAESLASESGARMTSMDNATRNAGEMIDNLTLIYNRTRQGRITTELVEIIAGAESV